MSPNLDTIYLEPQIEFPKIMLHSLCTINTPERQALPQPDDATILLSADLAPLMMSFRSVWLHTDYPTATRDRPGRPFP